MGLTIFHPVGIFPTFRLDGKNIWKYSMEYCESHIILLWIWIALWECCRSCQIILAFQYVWWVQLHFWMGQHTLGWWPKSQSPRVTIRFSTNSQQQLSYKRQGNLEAKKKKKNFSAPTYTDGINQSINAIETFNFWCIRYQCIRATSHTGLRACDHYSSSTLIGGKGGAGLSSLHTTLEGPTGMWTQDGCEVYMDSYMASNG
jgi:hypothetical protein